MVKYADFAKALRKFYREKTNEKRTFLREDELKVYADTTTMLGIVPKTKEFQQFFEAAFEDFKPTNIKLDDFIETINTAGGYSVFGAEYVKFILELLKPYSFGDFFAVGTAKDYLLWVETEDFIILLAPRYVKDFELEHFLIKNGERK